MRKRRESSATRDLIQRARAGDEQAFGLLLERHQQRLQSLIHLRLGPRLRQYVEVEDVLQETYLRALKSLKTFRSQGRDSFFRWLGGIAEHVIQNMARYYLHTAKRMKNREVRLAQPAPEGGQSEVIRRLLQATGTSPSRVLRRNDRFDRLQHALDHLSKDHREVIMLLKVRSLSIKEVASKMGRSPEAVSMLLLRALRQLRSVFGSTDSLRLPPRSMDSEAPAQEKTSGVQRPPPDDGRARASSVGLLFLREKLA